MKKTIFGTGKKRILFVCLGNICRSPAAESIFRKKVELAGEGKMYEIDSAGLNGYHNGENADPRMRRAASERGYNITSISRKIEPITDFEKFDMIICMDDSNVSQLNRLANRDDYRSKIYKMTSFSERGRYSEVPDPYYSSDSGFRTVLDILEDCSDGLINRIKNDLI
ncbi:MAG: low molecular weight protein-tyrosine-phosphatase [Bacteroidales bacterium]